MKKSNKNLFWVSFADLMTSLFFVVLVLYVITYVMLKKEQKELQNKNTEYVAFQQELKVENERLNQILQLEQQFKPLQNDQDFKYLDKCKKYVSKKLSNIEIFEPNESTIKTKYRNATLDVGRKLEVLLRDLNAANENFSYLVIIEGNMANTWDKKYGKNNNYGYSKSYDRALAVYNLWQDYKINLRKYNSEILICGSGFNGLCRDENEENNKRFSIQIIPKIEYSATD